MGTLNGTLHDPVRVMKRAIRFASRDFGREALTYAHLTAEGEVVTCDSYRLYVDGGAWDGPEVDLQFDVMQRISKCKVKGNDEARVDVVGDVVTVTMGDGTEIVGNVGDGKFPKFRHLFPAEKPRMTAYMRVKEALPVINMHGKRDSAVRVESVCRDLIMCGANGEVEPGYRVEKACDGEDVAVALNAHYLKDALKAVGEYAEVRVWGAEKPVIVTWDGNTHKSPTVLLMPVRFERCGEPLVRQRVGTGTRGADVSGMERQPKKEEQMEKAINLSGAHVCITGTLAGMTRSEAFTRLKLVGGIPCERFKSEVTLMVVAAKAGKGKREKAEAAIAKGQEVRVIDGHEFVEALKAAEQAQEARAIELAAKRKAGAEIKATVKEEADVTAVVIEPKEKRMEELMKELEQLKAELKSTRKELDTVWKENANLKAKKPEPKEVPPAPKAPKAEPVEATAAAVSLKSMQEWCEGKGLIASQKREGTCIWVEGDSKAYADELKELGFRFAKKRKSWYLNPAA